jgi:hypothetical protein
MNARRFQIASMAASATVFILCLNVCLYISDILTKRGLRADETKTSGWTTPTELILLIGSAIGLVVTPVLIALLFRNRRKVSA